MGRDARPARPAEVPLPIGRLGPGYAEASEPFLPKSFMHANQRLDGMIARRH